MKKDEQTEHEVSSKKDRRGSIKVSPRVDDEMHHFAVDAKLSKQELIHRAWEKYRELFDWRPGIRPKLLGPKNTCTAADVSYNTGLVTGKTNEIQETAEKLLSLSIQLQHLVPGPSPYANRVNETTTNAPNSPIVQNLNNALEYGESVGEEGNRTLDSAEKTRGQAGAGGCKSK